MMDYQKEMIENLNLDTLNIPKAYGLDIINICCTSVDDAKSAIRICDDIPALWACVVYEEKGSNRTTLIRMLKTKIRKLEKEL